ncbi:hypothetical protein [Sphingomonas sp. GC_Shp_2]|uniref:hypothetical protein n=1 Tax=Sphingomonas sp. GC_Shp_2 TaxID=2937384 RepID=UPI00226A0700|nr:hypothetical protein [Sphingomonas sp. GC_Shp_2]
MFHALCVLDDAAHACMKGPLRPPLPGVRLALAYLYSVSNDRTEIYNSHRGVFDAFWKAITSDEPAYSVSMQNTIRGTEAHGCFAGICRRVGVAQTIDFGTALARARRTAGRSRTSTPPTITPEVDPGV